MGLQIRNKYAQVRSYCSRRFSSIYAENSFQNRLRKDQYLMAGMVLALAGIFMFYANASAMISNPTISRIPLLVLSVIFLAGGRKSIKKGFSDN